MRRAKPIWVYGNGHKMKEYEILLRSLENNENSFRR